ncbi:CYC2-like cyclin [Reticulomyxa filosa]|uniref:CYC2-like cyclin n=1 Tax=Reticulomyxa filosa TaxID=46433 RepID=X6NCY1_RETFI|nr:CYC2-like cyclin [Reticulomyxa filosa]|eukprot:ETO23753.1 CYC2-like cyclin [Reticulomyxa filosa]
MEFEHAHSKNETNNSDIGILKDIKQYGERSQKQRVFGLELTNLVKKCDVIGRNKSLQKSSVDRELKRSFRAAQLENGDMPPSKKYRPNLTEKRAKKESKMVKSDDVARWWNRSEDKVERNGNDGRDMTFARKGVGYVRKDWTWDMMEKKHEVSLLEKVDAKGGCVVDDNRNGRDAMMSGQMCGNNSGCNPCKTSKYFEEVNDTVGCKKPNYYNNLACMPYTYDIICRLEYTYTYMYIMEWNRETEERHIDGEHRDYMCWQKDINSNMRSILLDWIIDVHQRFDLLPATLYLCVNLLDRYLRTTQVGRAKLQLTGCACLWLASKYHEIYAPDMRDLVMIRLLFSSLVLNFKLTKKNYVIANVFFFFFFEQELIEQESKIVNELKFHLTVPTPLAFADRFLKVSICNGPALKDQKRLECLVYYLLEHCLMSYELSCSLPSKVAAACLAYSLLTISCCNSWPNFLEHATRYGIKDLFPILECIDGIVKMDGNKCKHKAVRRKYSSKQHYCEVNV